MASKPTSSAAAKRVQASKARQRSRIQKPKPIGQVGPGTTGIDAIKAVMAQDTGTKLPKEQPAYGGQYGSTAGMDAYNRNNPSSPDNMAPSQVDDGGLGAMQAALAAQMAGGGKGVSDKEIAKLLSQSVNGTYNPQIKAIQ